MVKKFFSVLMAVLILQLCACSSDPYPDEIDEDEPEITSAATITSAAAAKDDGGNLKPDNASDNNSSDNNGPDIGNTPLYYVNSDGYVV